MELTKKQIQQIDTFLEGIGMEFMDVRYEMVDHIAAEIEEKVSDKATFFENRKLQTPFLKYMLSRKNELIKNYEKQEKKKFWSTFRLIFKDIKLFVGSIKNIFLLSLFIGVIFMLANYQLKNTLFFLLAATISLGVFSSLYLHYKFKKIGRVRLATSYYFLLMLVPNLSIQIPNWLIVYQKNEYHFYYLYIYLLFFILELLVCFSFYKSKEKIEKQYQLYIS